MKLSKRAQRNIIMIGVIKFLRSSLFIMPIMTVYFQHKGLGLSDVFLIQTIFSIAIFVLEIPTGYFGDLYGRKASILCGVIFAVLGFSIYPFARQFGHFIGAEILLALSSAFISGSDSALIYDTLLQEGKHEQYKKVWGRQSLRGSIGETIAGIGGGWLASYYDLLMPFWVTALIMIFTIPAALLLTETSIHQEKSQENIWNNLIGVFKQTLIHNKQLRRTIIYSGALASSTLSMVWLTQPYMQSLHIPLAWFGIIWATIRLSVGFWGSLSHQYEKIRGVKNSLISLIILIILGYLLAATQIWRFGRCLLIFSFVRGIQSSIFSHYINELSGSTYRATVSSIDSMISRILFCIIGPLIGFSVDYYSLSIGMIYSAVLFGLLGIFACYKVIKLQSS